MIDWRCGPSDATILSGEDDAFITSFATELAHLKAPVFLRWFYEFNFPNSPDYKACIGSLGPAGYAAAFRHIHALFVAAGASNVSFVWCIAAGGQDQDWIKYYPGPAYVDWIAVDGYLRNENNLPARPVRPTVRPLVLHLRLLRQADDHHRDRHPVGRPGIVPGRHQAVARQRLPDDPGDCSTSTRPAKGAPTPTPRVPRATRRSSPWPTIGASSPPGSPRAPR